MATNAVCLGCPTISVTIPPRIVLHAQIIKLKALLVVKRIVSWQMLRMDKCVCLWCIYFTRMHKRGLMPHVFFAFAHTCAVLVVGDLYCIVVIWRIRNCFIMNDSEFYGFMVVLYITSFFDPNFMIDAK